MRKFIIPALFLCLLIAPACKKKTETPKTEAPAPATADAKENPKEIAPANAEAKAEGNQANPEAKAEGDLANAEPQKENKDICPQGLILDFRPSLVENIARDRYECEPDGNYVSEYFFDGVHLIGVYRSPANHHFDEDSIARDVRSKWKGEPYNILVRKSDKESERLQHTAWEITYLTGHNEDTTQHYDVFIPTDTFDYRFHTSVPIDYAESYANDTRRWLENVEFRQQP